MNVCGHMYVSVHVKVACTHVYTSNVCEHVCMCMSVQMCL